MIKVEKGKERTEIRIEGELDQITMETAILMRSVKNALDKLPGKIGQEIMDKIIKCAKMNDEEWKKVFE